MKDKYEISIWEDYLVASEDGVPAHFEERKIGIIGSDKMTSQIRAIAPTLVNNVNGTSTLTFQLYYSYIDNETGEKVRNPWTSLLVNERKVKVLWKGKWYDMVVKSIQESSDKHVITYTCKDAFINELSKNGFSLEFDNELQNNTGTINELAAAILEGTDWKLGEDVILNQTIEEPVYEAELANEFTVDEKTFEAEAKILVYYSIVTNRESYCQFWYDPSGVYKTESTNQLVLNGECYGLDGVSWVEGIETSGGVSTPYIAAKNNTGILFKVYEARGVSDRYRAKRLVRKQKTIVDPKLDRTVNIYMKGEEQFYGYSETEYKDPTFVNSIVAMGENFSSTSSGWSGSGLRFVLYPDWTKEETVSKDYRAVSHLGLNSNTYYLNRGVKNCQTYIPDGFQTGEKWVLRYKAREGSESAPTSDSYAYPTVSAYVGYYSSSTDENTGTTVYTPKGESYFKKIGDPVTSDDWTEQTYECIKPFSKSEISKATYFNFLFMYETRDEEKTTIWLEKIEFFPYVEGYAYELKEGLEKFDDNVRYYEKTEANIYIETSDLNPVSSKSYYLRVTRRINPGELDMQSIAQIYYKYYDPTQNYSNEDDIIYEYIGTEKQADFLPYYGTEDNKFEKVRTITGKESNRFNLLQNLCETFECWAVFETEHDPFTGAIIYDNGCPKKTVTFREEIGERTGLGFIYGMDLKTIQRTVNSEQIVTKTIVKPNSNECATNGFCTIARARDNYSKESFVLDFGYYISQGLLSSGQLTKDLYMTTPDSIGYYYYLNRYNAEYDESAERLAAKKTELLKQEGFLTTYSEYLNSASDELTKLEDRIMSLASATTLDEALDYAISNSDYTALQSAIQTRFDLLQNWSNVDALVKKLEASVASIEAEVAGLEKTQEAIEEKIAAKHKEFWDKYSAYIQEGVWSSEDYVDDELYYLDACSVAYTSARPQTTYSISVLRLSALPEFSSKVFNLGDICYIQDEDFFGSQIVNGIKTPYKEEIFVSEITSYFDTPDKDTFKVQNYKTQFEDLFQRITATTQSLQYASGEYAKAAALVDSTGVLTYDTLQSAFARNEGIIQSAQNETIFQDATGITLVNANNPSYMLKLTSLGVLLTTDGGETWTTGVSGNGVSTETLTAGNINTDVITVLNEGVPQYRWDTNGISAYWVDPDSKSMWLNKFIRLDQHGLYGISNFQSQENQEKKTFATEDEIWKCDATRFALTWKGFLLKNTFGDGSIEINSETNQIIAKQGEVNRITIGKLDDSGKLYGLRIFNSDGETVLETDGDGKLWLQNSLSIGTSDNTHAAIGKLGKKDDDAVGRVIEAGATGEDNFIVYEDGTVYAKSAEIHGKIYADGGEIGGLSIASLPDTLGIRIQSDGGDTFKIKDGAATPSSLTFSIKTSIQGAPKSINWYFSTSPDNWGVSRSTNSSYTFTYNDNSSLFTNGLCYLKVVSTYSDEKSYEDVISLKAVSDGAKGEKGKDGISTYVHIRYSANADGTDFTDAPKPDTKYIGIATISSDKAPDEKTGYQWSEFKGADGQPGENGASSYLFIRYSANDDGSDYTFEPTLDTKYVGIYSGTSSNPNDNDFVWSLFVGTNGEDGKDANQYMIVTNQEEILKFSSAVVDDKVEFVFSPEILQIQLQDMGDEMFFPTGSYALDILYNGESFSEALGEDGFGRYMIADENTVLEEGEAPKPAAEEEDRASSEEEQNGEAVTEIETGITSAGIYFFRLAELYNDIKNSTYEFSNNIKQFVSAIESKDSTAIQLVATLVESKEKIVKWLTCKTGLSDDMAKLSVKANGIYMAMQKGGFEFSADGLRITNGNLLIGTQKADTNKFEPFFSATKDSLSITGTIFAKSGSIGGFSIGNKEISASGLRIISSDNDGKSRIIAENIEIGKGAEIADYIALGALRLQNPDKNGGIAIATTDKSGLRSLEISENGIITVGGNGIVQSDMMPDSTNRYWQLTKDGASFKNGNFSGVVSASEIRASTITTEVFKSLQTQAMGGAFIFRPSTRDVVISKSDDVTQGEYYLTFNDKDFVSSIAPEVNDGILIQPDEGETNKILCVVTEVEKYEGLDTLKRIKIKITDNSKIDLSQNPVISLIYLGQKNNNSIIGINSEKAGSGFMTGCALSMTDISYKDDKWINTTRLVLGDLSGISSIKKNDKSADGDDNPVEYGLYADNVHLRGNLVAHDNATGNNAGIDSKNTAKVTRTVDGKDIEDPIVFWAGAEAYSDQGIEEALFKVTRGGYLYAARGNFSNGIISDSTIESSTIKTAVIKGNGDGPSLIIYDTDKGKKGVEFRKEEKEGDVATLAITSEGFYSPSYDTQRTPFIKIDGNKVSFNGSSFKTSSLEVGGSEIYFLDSETSKDANINFTKNVVTVNGALKAQAEMVSVTSPIAELQQDIRFGIDGGSRMEYKKDRSDGNEGYSLYVY